MYLDNRPPPSKRRRRLERFLLLYWHWLIIGLIGVGILYGVFFSHPERFYWMEP